jgi:hypothetical protein
MTKKLYSLNKVTFKGFYFDEVGTDNQILVNLRITGSGKTIYSDIDDYELEEFENYIIGEV